MSTIHYGQWNQDGAIEHALGADAACLSKVFYISGFTVTKRKTSIRAQGGSTFKNMAAPCTTTATLAMSVVFKGQSDLWPSLFNKRFTVPVSPYTLYSYVADDGIVKYYTFYNPSGSSITYFSPDRKFYFTLSNIGICLPKELFNITKLSPLPTEAVPNPVQKSYFDKPHITSENLQYLGVTKKTQASFYFKSFEWSSGYSYCYSSLMEGPNPSSINASWKSPFTYTDYEKTTEIQKHFDEDCTDTPAGYSFLASDYCYEIEDGSLYFREMTLVPSDPELSDIMGIESITCKLTNSL